MIESDDVTLAPCPCGKIPSRLCIAPAGQGSKYALAAGHCCSEWLVEFRTNYAALDSDECMRLAMESWNRAPRGICGDNS